MNKTPSAKESNFPVRGIFFYRDRLIFLLALKAPAGGVDTLIPGFHKMRGIKRLIKSPIGDHRLLKIQRK